MHSNTLPHRHPGIVARAVASVVLVGVVAAGTAVLGLALPPGFAPVHDARTVAVEPRDPTESCPGSPPTSAAAAAAAVAPGDAASAALCRHTRRS